LADEAAHPKPPARERRPAGRALKRTLILEAARAVFESEGLDGASLRAIAAKAGYTPAALYFHFDSKEAIYAEVLQASMARLGRAMKRRVARAPDPAGRLRAAALGFFEFYRKNPRDLDLGFYLFRGGMKPRGLGPERDRALNAALAAQLEPIAAAAQTLGADRAAAERLMVECFAHAAGLLLLAHTGRIRMFGASAPALMESYVEEKLAALGAAAGSAT
jgi:AcrR family transcriptional regulator